MKVIWFPITMLKIFEFLVIEKVNVKPKIMRIGGKKLIKQEVENVGMECKVGEIFIKLLFLNAMVSKSINEKNKKKIE